MVSGSETRGQVDLTQLVPAYLDTVRYWDGEYEGVIGDIMNTRATPQNRISFRWPFAANSARMAPLVKETTPAVFHEEASYMDSFFTRISKSGWKMEPTMWDDEIQHGKMTLTLDFKIQMASDALMRRKDYEGMKYVFADASTVARYSTQPTTRLRTWDITSDSLGLTGNSWGTITGSSNLPDVLFDLDTIKYNAKVGPGAKILMKLLIGPKTFYSLQRNITIKEDIKYVHDVRENIVGANLKGFAIKEIVHAKYKENTSYDTVVGAPGLGSLMYDTWDAMKSKRMMLHQPGDGKTYEFAFATTDRVGTIWNAPVYTSPGFPQGSDVTNAWRDPDTLTMYAWRAIRFGFSVDDFAAIHKLTKICEVNAQGF